MREIIKIGLAVLHADRLLLVRKRGRPSYILPGGKPEADEADIQTLRRELHEELRCDLDIQTVRFLGAFSDTAADLADATVVVRLYEGRLIGIPDPDNEIEAADWVPIDGTGVPNLAPSLANTIMPFLFERRAAGRQLTGINLCGRTLR